MVGTRQGLEKGAVTRKAAWRVFGRNTNIRIVNIPMEKVLPVLGFLRKTERPSQGRVFRLAAPHPTMTGIMTVAGITHDALEPQAIDDNGLRQVDLLIEWLTSR